MSIATVSLVFGTRPEAIKLAPVYLRFRQSEAVRTRVCVTGQHREMLDQVLEVFAIRPDTDLSLMQPDQTLAALTARTLTALDRYYAEDRPDLVIVQGDTTTVLCASLAAFYRRIPVAHVEAGLRTGNLEAPWPEELNRVLTSRMARLHFAPTEESRQNLLREGVPVASIHVTGNTVIDALMLARARITERAPAIDGLPNASLNFLGQRPLVLITGHRRENFGAGLAAICDAIRELARRYPKAAFIYPVHLNPRVRGPVQERLGTPDLRDQVYLIEPLPYLPFVALMNRATLILTDSGGIQEEAPSLGKPVLVMRETTERPEAVAAGTVKLVGTHTDTIVAEASRLLSDPVAYQAMARSINPYGDGAAAPRIVAACLRFLADQG
jgi:UDP-N-acetylglucosamine 2-epimerase (non-hydrolysing)